MSHNEDQKHQYTMINNQEWDNPTGQTVLNFDSPTNGVSRPENIVFDDPYDITRLDHTWFPVIRSNLQNGSLSQRSQDGVPLVRVSSEADDTVDYVPSSDRPLASYDEIDARGSFDAREFERELRQMRRHDLGKASNYFVFWIPSFY